MIDKFFTDAKQLAVIQWLLNHPFGEYSVATVAAELKKEYEIEFTPSDMGDIIHSLMLYDIVQERHSFEGGYFDIKINIDSPIVKALSDLDHAIEQYVINFDIDNKLFNDFGTIPEHPVHNNLKKMVGEFKSADVDKTIDRLKNYKNWEVETDNPITEIMYKDLVQNLQALEESGEFEEFLDFVKKIHRA